jgi:hypothetical protein
VRPGGPGNGVRGGGGKVAIFRAVAPNRLRYCQNEKLLVIATKQKFSYLSDLILN